jgi:hypothetical protein
MQRIKSIALGIFNVFIAFTINPPKTIRQNQAMTWNYDKLPFNGAVKDYSEVNAGDTVEISNRSVILKSALKNMWNNEKSAMELRSREIGCELKEVPTKNYLSVRFLKV